MMAMVASRPKAGLGSNSEGMYKVMVGGGTGDSLLELKHVLRRKLGWSAQCVFNVRQRLCWFARPLKDILYSLNRQNDEQSSGLSRSSNHQVIQKA